MRLSEPARITGTIKSKDVPLSGVHVTLSYLVRGRALYPLLSAEEDFESPVHEMSLDLLCPAGCDLSLQIEAGGLGAKPHHKDQMIAPLKPGQVLEIGAIEFRPVSGYKAFGGPAPELQVGEWVKGKHNAKVYRTWQQADKANDACRAELAKAGRNWHVAECEVYA
mgnify:CR=1 FL=1